MFHKYARRIYFFLKYEIYIMTYEEEKLITQENWTFIFEIGLFDILLDFRSTFSLNIQICFFFKCENVVLV